MKKFEKYIDKVMLCDCSFIRKQILKTDDCLYNCVKCQQMAREWLLEEYKAEIDWLKVPANTPVLVRDDRGDNDEGWRKGYFAVYSPKKEFPFYVFCNGLEQEEAGDIIFYRRCKLADEVDPTPYLKEV